MPLPYQTDQAEAEGTEDREVSGRAGLRLHQLGALFLISSNKGKPCLFAKTHVGGAPL